MATKKVKKLAFGGMSNALRSAANKVSAAPSIMAAKRELGTLRAADNLKKEALARNPKAYDEIIPKGMSQQEFNAAKMKTAANEKMSRDAVEAAARTKPRMPARGLQALGAQAAAALQKAQAGAQKNAPSMEQLNAYKQATLGMQPGQKQVGGLGAAKQVGGLGAGMLGALKGGASSAGSGPMAKANPLQKMGSGPSRQAMMKKGGDVKESKAMVKKEIGFMKKAGAPKSMIKHEMAEAKGMKKGGMAECKTIAKKEVKGHEKRMHGMAKGGSIDGCAIRGKTKTSMIKMKKGGSC